MFSDGSSFLRRVNTLRRELERDSYPNAATLSQLAHCSRSTAQRTFDRLRDEYLAPIKYDSSRKGYYLKDKNFDFGALPPGKDELTALLLMRDMANALGDPELKAGIAGLWTQYNASNTGATVHLEDIVRHFSSDATEVAVLADNGVITYLNMAATGENVELHYQSPWWHDEERTYRGRIEHVHLENSNLYLLFHEENGNERILNAAFITDLEILNFDIKLAPSTHAKIKATNWLEGFGVWSGGELVEVEIHILPPAARYYAKQRWDATQDDSWDGDVLVRRMQSLISPEVVRRILGIARFVKEIKPAELKELVVEDAKRLITVMQKV